MKLPFTDVVTFGETMALMRAETPGPLASATSLALGLGGAESNVAIALRRLGTSVTWIGRVGDDGLGEKVAREITAEGVTVLRIIDATAPTGLMIKERRTNDLTRVWYYRSGSAGSRLSPADLPISRIQHARILHVTGITAGLSETTAAAITSAIAVAREAGVLVSFDLNYRSALWSETEAGPVFRSIIESSDIVFAGDHEAALTVGAGTPTELATRIAELGPTQVIIKRGHRGCTALIEGAVYEQDAVSITPVDTVGAGDAFVAGYLAELLRGCPPGERLHTAVHTGAFACLVPGDWEGMPRRAELGLLTVTEPVLR